MNMQNNIYQYVMSAMNGNGIMRNPTFANAVNLFRNHDSAGLNNLMNNVCRENNTTKEEQMKRLGFR